MSAYYNEHDPFAAAWLRELVAGGHIAPGVVDERDIQDVRPDDLRGYDQCHFFAGIGGWSYALRLAGWDDARPVWTGSCPCQPYSSAGKGEGADDARNLWPYWFRLIRECRPPVVFGEQVEAAVRHGWLDAVSTGLEAEDYAFGAAVLGAHSVGAPHIRQRAYFVADANRGGRGSGRQLGRLAEVHGRGADLGVPTAGAGPHRTVADAESSDRGLPVQQRRPLQAGPESERGGKAGAVADSRLVAGPEGRPETCPASRLAAREAPQRKRVRPDAGAVGGRVGDAEPGGCEGRNQERSRTGAVVPSGPWGGFIWIGCADGRLRPAPAEPALFPLASGIRNRVGTLRGSGNSIVPQTAAAFIAAYREAVSA